MRTNQNLKSFLQIISFLLLTAGSVASQPPIFVDVTEETGIHFKHNSGATDHKHIIETMGSGGVFFDYDTDGDVDLYFVDSGNVRSEKQQAFGNVLYRNEGDGRFTDVTEISGIGDTGYGMAASAGDIDNDGDPDLYVANFRQDKLYRNNGDGTFTDVNIRQSILIVVPGNGCHTSALNRIRYARCLCDIGKGAIAVVSVKHIRSAFVAARMPVTDNTFVGCHWH